MATNIHESHNIMIMTSHRLVLNRAKNRICCIFCNQIVESLPKQIESNGSSTLMYFCPNDPIWKINSEAEKILDTDKKTEVLCEICGLTVKEKGCTQCRDCRYEKSGKLTTKSQFL